MCFLCFFGLGSDGDSFVSSDFVVFISLSSELETFTSDRPWLDDLDELRERLEADGERFLFSVSLFLPSGLDAKTKMRTCLGWYCS